MNTRIRKRQQWQSCDRCGFMFPMSYLTVQRGLMLDRKCLDNLEIERRSMVVERVMGSGVEQEGVDLRMVDRGFFLGQNEEIF